MKKLLSYIQEKFQITKDSKLEREDIYRFELGNRWIEVKLPFSIDIMNGNSNAKVHTKMLDTVDIYKCKYDAHDGYSFLDENDNVVISNTPSYVVNRLFEWNYSHTKPLTVALYIVAYNDHKVNDFRIARMSKNVDYIKGEK